MASVNFSVDSSHEFHWRSEQLPFSNVGNTASGASDTLDNLPSADENEFSNIEDPTITTNIQDELYSNVRSTSDAPVAVAKCSPLNISSSTSHPSGTTFHEGMGIDRDPKGHLDTVEFNRAQLEKLQSCVENEIRGNPIPIFDLNTSLTAHSRTSIAPNLIIPE